MHLKVAFGIFKDRGFYFAYSISSRILQSIKHQSPLLKAAIFYDFDIGLNIFDRNFDQGDIRYCKYKWVFPAPHSFKKDIYNLCILYYRKSKYKIRILRVFHDCFSPISPATFPFKKTNILIAKSKRDLFLYQIKGWNLTGLLISGI